MKNILFLILIFTLFFSNISAQKDYNLNRFFREAGDVLERPVKWNAGEWLIPIGLAASTFAIMYIDEDVRSFMQSNQGFGNSIPMKFGTLYGEPVFSTGLGLVFLLHGISKNNNANERLGFEILQSFIYTGSFTAFAKYLFGRERPYSAKTAFEFNPLSFKNGDFVSFFSGHTSTAFSLSTVFAENAETTTWKIISYIPAFVTGFSRIYHNKHWTSDVFLGAAVGYFIGKFVVDRHKIEDNKDGDLSSPPLLNFAIPF